jgi:hypothetical protein
MIWNKQLSFTNLSQAFMKFLAAVYDLQGILPQKSTFDVYCIASSTDLTTHDLL